MVERGRATRLAVLGMLLLLGTGSAVARVQEYQVVRLITFRSSCHIDRLVERSQATGPLRFTATCENVSFYPDGLDVACDHRDDERSCRILTPAKHFDSLDLLRR